VFDQLVRAKEVKSLLEEVADGKKLKNVIPGKAVIDVSTPADNMIFVNRVTPSLGQVAGFSDRDPDVRFVTPTQEESNLLTLL